MREARSTGDPGPNKPFQPNFQHPMWHWAISTLAQLEAGTKLLIVEARGGSLAPTLEGQGKKGRP